MWGVWIILSAAVLVGLGVGIYFIVKHFTKKRCNCQNGCDKNGKCKSPPATVNSTWNPTTKSTGKNQLKKLVQNSNDQNLNSQLQSVNGQIPESVLSCALEKIMLLYKKPQDFINALNNQKLIPSIIQIVKDCMKGTPVDPNACNPPCKTGQKCVNKTCVPVNPPDPTKVCNPACNIGELCIQNGCVPRTWTTSFYNTFIDGMISDVQKTLPINQDIATCITDGIKKQYPNPQKMAIENQDTIQNLFNNLYKMCTQNPRPPHRRPHRPPQNPCSITISDTCKSKGQDARNRGLDCGDTINACMTSDGAISDDCLGSLENISAYTCSQMTRYKPGRHSDDGDKGFYYCNPPDDNNSKGCGSCMFVTDKSQVPQDFPYVEGVLGSDGRPNCTDINNCGDSQDCQPLTSGIY
jgi:hypothetical protein